MTRKWPLTALLAALIAATSFAPHALSQDQKAGEKAAKAEQSKNSGTMERADRDMRAVLEQLQQLGARPIATLSVEEARKQPSPAHAVKALMEKRGKEKPSAKVSTENVTYPAASGEQPARVYIPEAKGQKGEGQQGLPVIVYYHGGGWVIADLDTYEASAQALARKANAIVVSVAYRHAPEHKFPAAHEDSFAAYKWVLKNAEKWGGDPQRVAVAGESAGGNLASTWRSRLATRRFKCRSTCCSSTPSPAPT
jgi:acetyl esterase/lipase